jgi:predicted porin
MNGVTGVAAAPGFDGKVNDKRSYRDVIIYNTPALIPGLTGQIYLSEPAFNVNAAADTGLGAGSLGSTGQRKDILSLNYGAGALKANIGYISADNRDSANAASTKLANGYRLGGTYDAGVVLVGAGYERDSLDNGTDTTTALNVNVPLGAFSVGANWLSRQFSGKVGQVDGTKTGYGLGARYALSKSTAIWAQMWSFDDVVNTSDRSTGFEMAIAKSF